MMDNLPLPLAAWNDYIGLMLVGAMVIGSWIANMKKKGAEQRKRDEGPASMEPQEVAARRREQSRQASRSRVQASQGGSSAGYSAGGAEPGNLTMAERIARARAKAQYEQRAQGSGQPAQRAQPQVPNEAQRRALAQRQAELQRRQQAAQAQANQRAQQQAQQRARLQAQQQRAQAQAHASAQAQARRHGVLLHDHAQAPAPIESTTRRLVPGTSTPKRPPSPPATRPAASRLLTSASLSRDDLRRAIVLNEVLGKPVALRDEAGFSY